MLFFLLRIRRPPRSTLTYTLFPYTRSSDLQSQLQPVVRKAVFAFRRGCRFHARRTDRNDRRRKHDPPDRARSGAAGCGVSGSILILAGRRTGAEDPLAKARGVADKCLVPVSARPMIAHVLESAAASAATHISIGSASSRERMCQYGEYAVVAVSLKKKK